MKKFCVCVSGYIDVGVVADNKEQASEKVRAVLDGEKNPSEVGIPTKEGEAIMLLENFEIDVYAQED